MLCTYRTEHTPRSQWRWMDRAEVGQRENLPCDWVTPLSGYFSKWRQRRLNLTPDGLSSLEFIVSRKVSVIRQLGVRWNCVAWWEHLGSNLHVMHPETLVIVVTSLVKVTPFLPLPLFFFSLVFFSLFSISPPLSVCAHVGWTLTSRPKPARK